MKDLVRKMIIKGNGEKILNDLNTYVDTLIQENESLRDKLNIYNKDDEIKNLKDEIKDIRNRSLEIMSEKEKQDAERFSKEHYESCKGNVSYTLVGTGIGNAITIKCLKCRIEEDITDHSNW